MVVQHEPHRWDFCSHCERRMVICGQCGNNCCNGGYGEVIGKEPGTTMQCTACPSAYDLQNAGESQFSSRAPTKETP